MITVEIIAISTVLYLASGTRVERVSSESKSDVLPLHYPEIFRGVVDLHHCHTTISDDTSLGIQA